MYLLWISIAAIAISLLSLAVSVREMIILRRERGTHSIPPKPNTIEQGRARNRRLHTRVKLR